MSVSGRWDISVTLSADLPPAKHFCIRIQPGIRFNPHCMLFESQTASATGEKASPRRCGKAILKVVCKPEEHTTGWCLGTRATLEACPPDIAPPKPHRIANQVRDEKKGRRAFLLGYILSFSSKCQHLFLEIISGKARKVRRWK